MTGQDTSVTTGGCLCGAVRYAVRGPLRRIWDCHCGQCRRWHGHVAAYTRAERDDIDISDAGGALTWFQSSDTARRGFCATCGSSLFWDRLADSDLSIAAGSLDQPSGLTTEGHIYVSDKADYYEIADGLEQVPGTKLGTG